MLAALMMAFLLGGGGGVGGAILTTGAVKQLGKEIQAEVSDSARAEAAAGTLAELKSEIKSFEKTFAKSGKQLTKLYKDQSADDDELQAALDQLNGSWQASQERAIDLRFRLKESLTEEEWTAVFGGD